MKDSDKFKFDVAQELVEDHDLSATDAMGAVSFYSLAIVTYGDVTGAVLHVLGKLGLTDKRKIKCLRSSASTMVQKR